MIIDARHFEGDRYSRPGTTKGAVFAFMDTMGVGDSVRIDAMYDKYGRDVPINRFQAYLSQHSNGRRFSTRNLHDGSICHVYRLA